MNQPKIQSQHPWHFCRRHNMLEALDLLTRENIRGQNNHITCTNLCCFSVFLFISSSSSFLFVSSNVPPTSVGIEPWDLTTSSPLCSFFTGISSHACLCSPVELQNGGALAISSSEKLPFCLFLELSCKTDHCSSNFSPRWWK